MPYTPYTLHTILAPLPADQKEEPVPTPNNSSSFFSRRPNSPPNEAASPVLRLSSNHITAKIDSVGAWDSDLYCGTSEGFILHYSLQDNHNNGSLEKKLTTHLENTINLGYGKKCVERILLMPQVSKAIVLCAEEGRIGEDGTVELVVVKKRAIQIYKIGESMQIKRELPLTDGAITITRYGHILCLADHQSYKLINLSISSLTTLSKTPQMPSTSTNLILGSQLIARPLVAVVKKEEFLIVDGGSGLGHQTIGICLNANGDPVRGTLQWSNYPKSICVEFPYVVALLSNHTIEIHNIQDQKLLQKIPVDPNIEAKGLAFGHGIKVCMDSLAKSLKRTPWKQQTSDPEMEFELQREAIKYSTIASRILVYGKDSVMAQITTPLTIQVDGLLENSLVEEAMQLADQARNTMSEEDYDTVYAERLKHELNYTFQKSGLILLKETLFDDSFSLLSKGNIDPRIVVEMFDGLMKDRWMDSPPSILLFDSVQQLIKSLGSLKDIVNNSMAGAQESNHLEMRRVLFENAREALSKYLIVEREKRLIKSAKNSMICEVIDTCLLQLYMSQEDDTSLYKFLQLPNSCNVEDCSEVLLNAQKYYALSIMYESKKIYEKTLELWTRIFSGDIVDPEFKDGLKRIKNLLLKDVDNKVLPLSAVMQYASWLAHRNPEDGVDVFIRSPRAKDMNPDEVLSQLENLNNQVVQLYLEHLVTNLNSENPEYYTRLACSYVSDICNVIEAHQDPELPKKLVDDFKKKVNPYLRTDDNTTHLTFVGYLSTQERQTPLVRQRLKLLKFLLRSNFYIPETVMEALTKAGPLDVEKCVVYGRMAKHKESLNILVDDLSDFVGAETYCISNGLDIGTIHVDTPARSSSLSEKHTFLVEDVSMENIKERCVLFDTLFDIYRNINDSKLMHARTVNLLNTQGLYLDTAKVLNSIPDDWPINILQQFLTKSLQKSVDDYNESQLALSLTRGENLMTNSDLIQLFNEAGPATVGYQTSCLKCYRPIGDNIFTRENESGDLFHLHCAKILGYIE